MKRSEDVRWVVALSFDSHAEALEFATHVRRTGVVDMPRSAEWQSLDARVTRDPYRVDVPCANPRGGRS